MARFGFCGPSYQSQSLNVDAERCVNFYPESVEVIAGKSALALYPTPGSVLFASFPMATSIRGFIGVSSPTVLERVFVVAGNRFYELFQDGSFTDRTQGKNFLGTGLASMAASPTQILIVDGGQAFVFNLTTNGFQALQTFTAGAGLLAAPFSIVAAGQFYAVNDTVAPPAAAGGTGGVFTVTAATAIVTSTAGRASGIALSNVSGKAAPFPSTAGQIVVQGQTFNLAANALKLIAPTNGTVAPNTNVSYLYYNSQSGFYYSPSPTPTLPDDAYIAKVSANISSPGPGGVYQGVVISQPATGTNTVNISGGAVTAVGLTTDGTGYAPQQNSPMVTLTGSGQGLVMNYSTTSSSPGSGIVGNPFLCAFIDGFFIILQANSQTIQVSQPEDASTWDPTQVAQVSVFVDNVVSMIAAYRQLWLQGSKQSQVYYDSGNVFPFDVVPGGFIEQGCGATFATVRLDNSIFWLGEDERGARIAWRANGYTPLRVSNHAVEWRWQQYLTIADATAYAWQYSGHSFWRINFPTAAGQGGETWEYDAATGMWHEVTSWNPTLEQAEMHHSQSHIFAFGKHLMGDRQSGNIYAVSPTAVQENGNPIQRIRISPYIFREHEWIRHQKLEIDFEVGLAPQPPLVDGDGNPREPQVYLQWSDDQAKTWSFGRVLGLGFSGNYIKRVIAFQLGRSRGRVYRITCTDPVFFRIADAYLTASPGFTAGERLASQFGKLG